ncbi:MAG: MarC family protein [Rhodospirillales bacterium]
MDAWAEHTRFGLSLFALISPLTVVPIFLGLTAHLTHPEKRTAATVAALTLLAVLIGGYFVGEPLIGALGSSIASFQIAGGAIIAMSGFSMLNAPAVGSASGNAETHKHSAVAIGIVPVGMPLLGGPGSLSAVMLEGHGHFSITHEEIVISIILACVVLTWVILLFAGGIARVMGNTGLSVFQRAFGIIVISVGVEVISRGVLAHADRYLASG